MKDFSIIILAVAVFAVCGAVLLKDTTVVVNQDGEKVGAIPGDEVYNEVGFLGGMRYTNKFVSVAKTSVYSTTTLTYKDSGTIFSHSASGTTMTLPAVTTKGATFTFVVGGALDTGNVLITSAEGDNIEGSLVVAGAVVACDAADVITFVVDGENIGDFVTVVSNGTNWIPLQSGALTASKLTCSG